MERKRLLLIVIVILAIVIAVYTSGRLSSNLSPKSAVNCVWNENGCSCPISNPVYDGCAEASNQEMCAEAVCGANPTPINCKCSAPASIKETIQGQGGLPDRIVSYNRVSMDDSNCKAASSASMCTQSTCTATYGFLGQKPTFTKTYPCSLG